MSFGRSVGSLGGPWLSLGGPGPIPGRPWAGPVGSLGESEAFLGIAVSATNSFGIYKRGIMNDCLICWGVSVVNGGRPLVLGTLTWWTGEGMQDLQELAMDWLEPHIIYKRHASLADAANFIAPCIPLG